MANRKRINKEAAKKERCNTLREEGNKLYKSLDLDRAVISYRDASKIDPTDPRPLSNLSVCYYELGNYAESFAWTQKALALYEANAAVDEASESKVARLNERLHKIRLHETKEHDIATAAPLMQLPRYRGSLSPSAKYHPVGHDTATSLYDEAILEGTNWKPDVVSFFFGGIGDARHLYCTLVHIAGEHSEKTGILYKLYQRYRRYHFTINDSKAPVIARDLIVCLLLEDLSTLPDENDQRRTQIQCTLFFLWSSRLMPKACFDHLQRVIDRALLSLTKNRQPLDWFQIRLKDMKYIVRSLVFWQKEVVQRYSTGTMVEAIYNDKSLHLSVAPPKALEFEKDLFEESGFLLPPPSLLGLEDPELPELIKEKTKATLHSRGAKLRSILSRTWFINPTMIDPDLQKCKNAYENSDSDARRWWDAPLDVGENPFLLVFRLYEESGLKRRKEEVRLCDHVDYLFKQMGYAIHNLRGRFVIEAIVGDCFSVLEQIRLGIGYRDSDVGYPTHYDRIHLSNIANYMGGHLSSFLQVLPSLTTKPAAYLALRYLRKSRFLTSIDHYLAEYLAIPGQDPLAKLLWVNLGPLEDLRYSGQYDVYSMLQPKKLRFDQLVTQEVLRKWLLALYFMLALPVRRPHSHFVMSPLNFTIYFRVLRRLSEIGYPAHWLSDILCDILTGQVKSTARPRRMDDITVEGIEQERPLANLSTAPFVAEIAVLCTMFKPLLPFRFESDSLPVKEVVYRYTIAFPGHHAIKAEPNCFVLWFFDDNLFRKCGLDSNHIRSMLDPSPSTEVDARYDVPAIKTFREKGVAIWSVMECNVDKKVVSFYAHKSFVDKMIGSDWCVSLLRTDMWYQVDGCNARAKDIVERRKWDKGSDKP